MLLEIAGAPTAENSAILLDPRDNIAVARVPVAAGAELRVNGVRVVAAASIPAGHKVALRGIAAGEIVLRYGHSIGRASAPIAAGEHVHTHNLAFEDLQQDYEFPAGESGVPERRLDGPTFLGYRRGDGRVGTRNYIAIAAASNCSAHTVESIARSYEGQALPAGVDGVVAFPHGDGCGQAPGGDLDQLRRTMRGVLDHPNVSAGLMVGLGCEVNQIDSYPTGSRLAGLTLQSSGGTRATIEAARREVDRFIERAGAEKRIEAPASVLVLGLNCGGSDSFSGITANPALGCCSDLLAELGGSSVLAETPEIVGAEHLLVKRARNRQVAEKLLEMIRKYRQYLGAFGSGFDHNPSPGNKAGGLTNILEKSLGAVAKGGTSTMIEVYDYAERIAAPGFGFMNTPGYDPVSLAGLAAGGATLIAFTTGRGSAIGFPTIPVIKIASNTPMYRRMSDNMDVNAGAVADGAKSIQEMGREIFDIMLEVASGRRTSSERLGHKEFVPWRMGPVL
jgi:altronate hydrolase